MYKYNSDTLFHKFHHCANIVNRSCHMMKHNTNRENSIHRGQGKLLYILVDQDGISQKEIVDIMDIRPSSVGELVAKLEQQGYVEKKIDENDKRVSNIYITDSGREAVKEAIEYRNTASNELFSGLTSEEQKQLADLLDKITGSLKEKFGSEHDKKGCGHGRRHQGYHEDHHGLHHKKRHHHMSRHGGND